MFPPTSRGTADRGLARERTALAWNRSGLAVVVCVGVLLRHLWPLRGPGKVTALGAIAAAAIVWAVALVAYSASGARRDADERLGAHVLLLMTLGTFILAVAGLALAFFAAP